MQGEQQERLTTRRVGSSMIQLVELKTASLNWCGLVSMPRDCIYLDWFDSNEVLSTAARHIKVFSEIIVSPCLKAAIERPNRIESCIHSAKEIFEAVSALRSITEAINHKNLHQEYDTMNSIPSGSQ